MPFTMISTSPCPALAIERGAYGTRVADPLASVRNGELEP
jgi:hypothetical protein